MIYLVKHYKIHPEDRGATMYDPPLNRSQVYKSYVLEKEIDTIGKANPINNYVEQRDRLWCIYFKKELNKEKIDWVKSITSV